MIHQMQIHRGRSPRVFLCGAVLALASAGGSLLAQDPAFHYGFDGPDSVSGPEGSDVEFEVLGTIETAGLEAGTPGVQGWSASMAASGCEILAIEGGVTQGALHEDDGPIVLEFNDSGVPDGGFAKTELAVGGIDDCAGRAGAVVGLVLSFTAPVTLDPGQSPHDMFLLRLGATVGIEEDCSCTIEYVNSCQGSGQPVSNNVTLNGQTHTPTLGSTSVCIEPSSDCRAADINVTVSEENTGIVEISSQEEGGVTEGNDPLEVCVLVREGASGMATIYANIVSTLDGQLGGIQGWSLGARVDGGISVFEATVEGTAGAEEPVGIRDGGFEQTQIIDPANNGGVNGATSAVVISFGDPTTLPIGSRSTVLCLTVVANELQGADPISGTLSWQDGLVGDGQPVRNVATIDGNSNRYTCCQPANVTFKLLTAVEFLRGDSNDDGQVDIADSVHTVNQLFRGGPIATCLDAADANNDALVDISDSIYTTNYRFLGGAAPPFPFPDCGEDPEGDADGIGCDLYTSCP